MHKLFIYHTEMYLKCVANGCAKGMKRHRAQLVKLMDKMQQRVLFTDKTDNAQWQQQ